MNCAICNKENAKTCSACKLVAYCGTEHQKQDWKNHKTSCRQSRPAAAAIPAKSGPVVTTSQTQNQTQAKENGITSNGEKFDSISSQDSGFVSDIVIQSHRQPENPGNVPSVNSGRSQKFGENVVQNSRSKPAKQNGHGQKELENNSHHHDNSNSENMSWACEELMNNVKQVMTWPDFMTKLRACRTNVEKIEVIKPFFKWTNPGVVSQNEQMVNSKSSAASKMFMVKAACALKAGAYEEALKCTNMMTAYGENSTDLDLGELMRATCIDSLPMKSISRVANQQLVGQLEDFGRKLFTLESVSPMNPSMHNCVRINYDKERGRNLVVTQDVPAGTTLLVEKPFVSVSTELFTMKLAHCAHCYRKFAGVAAPTPCPNCPFALFCNDLCAKSANFYHQYECSASAHIRSLLIKMKSNESSWLLAFRVICQLGPQKLFQIFRNKTPLDTDPQKDPHKKYDPMDYVNLWNLQGFFDPLEISPPCIALAMSSILQRSTSFFGEIPAKLQDKFGEFIAHALLHHYKCFLSNALNLNQLEEDEKPEKGLKSDRFGAAIYLTACLMNHSCEPNVLPCWNVTGGEICVRAARPLKQGEELCWSYCPNYCNKERTGRQAELLEKYKFKCQCSACLDNWPTLTQLKARSGQNRGATFICPKCDGGQGNNVVLSKKNGFKCSSCNSSYSEKNLLEQLEGHRRVLTGRNIKVESVEGLMRQLEEASTFFRRNLAPPTVEQGLILMQMEFHLCRTIHALSRIEDD